MDNVLTVDEATGIKGVVFNIQHYSIHDGPGIRTTVFMKGCPLSCIWCQNPESQKFAPELFFNIEACTGCGKCVQYCPTAAIEIIEGHSKTKRELCRANGKCAEVCPNEARTIMGSEITAENVFKDVFGDKIFYDGSGGGVTLSGGEPLAQPQFALSLLAQCKKAGLHTAIETCGYAKWESLQQILRYVDLVLFDIKHMDTLKHKEFTGVSNELILDNVKKIHHELHIPIWARIPVITSYNDSPENIEATAQFITRELDTSIKTCLIPYHRLGETKYDRLEKVGNCVSIEPPKEERLLKLQKIMDSYGLSVQIGG